MIRVGDKVWPEASFVAADASEAMLVTRVIPIEQIGERDKVYGPLVFVDGHDSPRLMRELVVVSCGHTDCEANEEMLEHCLAGRECSKSWTYTLRPHDGMQAPHPCPFRSEIHSDESPCNCCEQCQWECAQGI